MNTLFTYANICPLCNQEKISLICSPRIEKDIYFQKLNIRNEKKVYSGWYFCKSCEGAFNNIRLTNKGMLKMYSSSITSMDNKNALERFKTISELNKNESETFLKSNWFVSNSSVFNSKNLNFLDFGCGMGIFQWYLKNYFSKTKLFAYGIDPSKDYIECCKKKIKGKFMCGSDEKLNFFSDSFFDLISSITVLEHLLDPYLNLVNLRKKLSTNGELWIEVPSIKNFEILSADHDNFRCQHLFMHSENSIEKLLSKVGFVIKEFSHKKSIRGKFMLKLIAKTKN